MAFMNTQPKEDPKLKMRLVAFSAAAKALELKKKNPGVSDNEIMKIISVQVDDIVRNAQ